MPAPRTLRQESAFNYLVENGGSIGQAMRSVGYSKKTAKAPTKLTRSKGWNELVKERIPDSKVVTAISEGLDATKLSNSLTSPDIVLPDYSVRHKYVETALKIKGRMKESGLSERPQPILGIMFNVSINNGNPKDSQTPQEN